jgi:hemerythrin superfamily protein
MQTNSSTGVLGHIQMEHREIERMVSAVDTASGDARYDAFVRLVRKLAVHETAEEELIHPMLDAANADNLADRIREQEGAAKRALKDMDGMAINSPQFDTSFEKLRNDVKAHAEFEESVEHPRIAASENPDKLERLTSMFESAEKVAPTRPHPDAPDSRSGNLVLGPILAVADRVRDTLDDARRRTAG